ARRADRRRPGDRPEARRPDQVEPRGRAPERPRSLAPVTSALVRRAGLILIAVLGVLAILIDFVPGLSLPDFSGQGASRVIETKLGLDLRGGLKVEYQVKAVGDKAPTLDDLNVVKGIIERRVNATGVSEPVVVTSGTDRIVVEVPGVTDTNEIRKLVGQTGRLDFVPLPPSEYGVPGSPGQFTAVGGQPLPTRELPPVPRDHLS